MTAVDAFILFVIIVGFVCAMVVINERINRYDFTYKRYKRREKRKRARQRIKNARMRFGKRQRLQQRKRFKR